VVLLGKINGLYVPGDNEAVLDNEDYQKAVKTVLKYSREQNEGYNSFPVVFTQWAFLVLMQQSSHNIKSAIDHIPSLHLSAQTVS